jgi:signal transduction histidine kinase/CheY-like chemotaxis protein
MPTPLRFANWSLRKALLTVPDSFTRARVRIVYILLLFSLVKGGVVIAASFYVYQPEQIPRAIAALIAYGFLMKILLTYPNKLLLVSHIMVGTAIILIYTNVFLYTHRVNLITLQFVFMTMLGSFYALGNRPGIIYSALAAAPVLAFLFTNGTFLRVGTIPHELASPAFEIITTLNFITIGFAHYYFFKAFHDNIGEKELLNQQLQVAVGEAKKLAEARSSFLAMMSHELRTPLNSVVGVTELMQEDGHHQQEENLGILRNSALDLLSLINNILDINKLDSGKLQLETVSFNLYQHVDNICSALSIKARDKKLKLVFEAEDALKDITITSDPTRLSQVLYNLIGNAIKFTEHGSVTVKMVTEGPADNKIDVRFSVADTGIGIHADRHHVIFESFTQAEPDTTRKYGGTGLGLSIVQQVLTLFNSGINLHSEPGKGATFFFTLSFDIVSRAAGEVAGSPVQNRLLDHLKILVAEDNDINTLVLQKQLDNLKVSSVMVTDGIQAYEAYINGDYDAVLLDLDMPGWNGYETTQRIRSYSDPAKSDAYLIAFTASVSEQSHIIEQGFNDFLYKPVSIKDLREKLEKVPARRSAGMH